MLVVEWGRSGGTGDCGSVQIFYQNREDAFNLGRVAGLMMAAGGKFDIIGEGVSIPLISEEDCVSEEDCDGD